MSESEGPIVQTKNGRLRGVERVSQFSGRTYYSFLGIPYARPPVDDLRFMPPVEAENWRGIRDASAEGDDCVQFNIQVQKIVGSEDCLYLNVHVPELPPDTTTLKPVMVLVHSGGHLWGSGTTRIHGSPDFLMHHDVIYVTFNYRLHIFGFLNLRLPQCPGNVGLKDALMALEWVKENISTFGGDANNITLCGQCTGASMIHFLMMCPRAKGLYQRVILMGDYVFNPLCNYQEDTLDLAIQYCKLLGFISDSPERLLRFLKKQSPLKLCAANNQMNKYIERKYGRMFPTSPFLPSIEFIDEGSIISQSPVKLMHSIEPVSLMYGVCENEAIFGFLDKIKLTPGKQYKKILKENCWTWTHDLDNKTLNAVIDKIKTFYFGKEKLYDVKSAVNIYNDLNVAEFYNTVADVIAKKSPSTPTYVYSFRYLGRLNKMRSFMGLYVKNEIQGTVHADDYFYMVKSHHNSFPYDKNDTKAIHDFTTLVMNFAKTGNPNDSSIKVKWEPSTPKKPRHLIFGNELEMHDGKINHERLLFWEELRKEYPSQNFDLRRTQ